MALERNVRFASAVLGTAVLISGALTGLCVAAQTQSPSGGAGSADFSSTRPGPDEAKSGWTAAKMRRAQPTPLGKADPEAVRAEARRQPAASGTGGSSRD